LPNKRVVKIFIVYPYGQKYFFVIFPCFKRIVTIKKLFLATLRQKGHPCSTKFILFNWFLTPVFYSKSGIFIGSSFNMYCLHLNSRMMVELQIRTLRNYSFNGKHMHALPLENSIFDGNLKQISLDAPEFPVGN